MAKVIKTPFPNTVSETMKVSTSKGRRSGQSPQKTPRCNRELITCINRVIQSIGRHNKTGSRTAKEMVTKVEDPSKQITFIDTVKSMGYTNTSNAIDVLVAMDKWLSNFHTQTLPDPNPQPIHNTINKLRVVANGLAKASNDLSKLDSAKEDNKS